MDWTSWQHVFKLDPAKPLSDRDLERICESGTDAILVGGSDDVTLDGVLDLLVRVRRYALPVALEVTDTAALSPGFDYFFVPSVLNTAQERWFKGHHVDAIREWGHLIEWDSLVMEGYCILNPDCKAAALSGANAALEAEDVVAYAQLADRLFSFPIVYLEYSGRYGDPALVRRVRDALSGARLFYGGGIRSAAQAAEMAAIAHTVVVGNLLYEDLSAALATVQAVRRAAR